MTWEEAWGRFAQSRGLGDRAGQMQMGREVFANTAAGGQLVVQAPTGTGKSLAYMIPLIDRALQPEPERSVVSTETLSLLDQLVDKDLPMLAQVFPGFRFFGLKGRNHYLCHNKAGSGHAIAGRLRSLDVGHGERRDVERVVGRRLEEDEWRDISSDSDFCSTNQCSDKFCYSTRARKAALEAHIVVTSHAMLRTHGDMEQQGNDGVLGVIRHVVVDEAHTLEQVFVSGGTISLTPWELTKKTEAALSGTTVCPVSGPAVEEAERLLRGAVDDITAFMDSFKGSPGLREWSRESMKLGLYYLSGGQDERTLQLLDDYETRARARLLDASQKYDRLAKQYRSQLESVTRGKRKARAGMNACQHLASLAGLIALSMTDRNAMVEAYGSTYVMLADGWKTRNHFRAETKGVRLRAVPLDVSGFARGAIWNGLRSLTVVSATLADPVDGGFRYIKRSLGMDASCAELTVASPFDYSSQQMVYLTPGVEDPVDVPGARYSRSELRSLLRASDGRALVLFTSRAELDDCARALRADSGFPWELLVQDADARKSDLVQRFTESEHSVLLATKSFFTGMDFQGSTCSLVALVKWPNPQWNDLTRAQVAYWRDRGFPKWYESNGLQVFTQASGRLIRASGDRGVVALLDNRVAGSDSSIAQVLSSSLPVLYPGSEVTSDAGRVGEFFAPALTA